MRHSVKVSQLSRTVFFVYSVFTLEWVMNNHAEGGQFDYSSMILVVIPRPATRLSGLARVFATDPSLSHTVGAKHTTNSIETISNSGPGVALGRATINTPMASGGN